jgi:hypothetical protein
MTLSSSGELQGTPTRSGTYTFTVLVRDSAGASTTQTFTVRVLLNPPTAAPTPTSVPQPTSTLPPGITPTATLTPTPAPPLQITTPSNYFTNQNDPGYGVPYSASIGVTGGVPPYTWGFSGSLPSGISFSNGTISGTANYCTSQDYYFTVTVYDSVGSKASQSYDMTYSCIA